MRRPSLLVLAALAIPASSGAAVFNVTKTADTADGACDADCSLREAVIAANAAGAGRHVVGIPAGTYTIAIPKAGTPTEADGDFNITNSMDLVGAGRGATIVDANHLDRVFTVTAPDDPVDVDIFVRFMHLTIQNGMAATAGGGILTEGNYENLSVLDSEVKDNASGAGGGGIQHYGVALAIADSFITGNHAHGAGGGLVSFENYNLKKSRILRTVFRDNVSDSGGGGVSAYRSLVMDECLIADNTAGSDGGGMDSAGNGIVIRNTTFSGNHAGRHGGAAYFYGAQHTFESVTIADNTADSTTPGVELPSHTAAAFTNTLFSGNGCLYTQNVTSGGGNVETGNTCALGAQDQVGVGDAKIGPLADNGGTSETCALLGGSPALGAAVQERCPFVDQRGFIRDDGDCDAGAFEAGAAEHVCGETLAEDRSRLQLAVERVSEDAVGEITACLYALAGYP